MNPTAIAFLGYISIMLILVFAVAGYRSALTLSGKRAANSFSPSGDDVSEMSKRLCRAHANCYEAFPMVGGILLYSLATNNTAITDPLAMMLIGARLLQSFTHLVSTSVFAVYLRFTFFVIQLAIVIYWMLLFFGQLPI